MADSVCHAPPIFNDIRNCRFFFIIKHKLQIFSNNFSCHLIPCFTVIIWNVEQLGGVSKHNGVKANSSYVGQLLPKKQSGAGLYCSVRSSALPTFVRNHFID